MTLDQARAELEAMLQSARAGSKAVKDVMLSIMRKIESL